ncbi:MAG TPA: hypothetical protein VE153_25605 [Myxococcus sp.]|nr:hypothetical protein [Myxococcus sp.]
MSVYLRFLRGASVAALFTALALAPAPAGAQGWSPTITWNTYLGGGTLSDGGIDSTGTSDQIESVALALDGDVIVTGFTDARTFPASPDAGLPTGTSSTDVFVARYSADGQTLRWARVFGGANADNGTRVAVTSAGTVYVVGTTQSPTINIGPGRPATTVGNFSMRKDGFLARLDANGTLEWFMYLGSRLDDEARDVVLGPEGSGRVYVVGRTGQDDGFGARSDDTPVPFPPDSGQSNVRLRAFEAFVSQVDVSNAAAPFVRWTRILMSDENDSAYSVAVQGDSVYVGGIVGSHFDAGTSLTATPVRYSFAGGEDEGFVARLESDAGISWFSYLGGDGVDDVRTVLARPDGGISAVGNTNSSNFAAAGGATDNDVYVFRLSPDGYRIASGIRVGMSGGEGMLGQAAMDRLGNVYVGGRTSSSAGFARNAFDPTLNNVRDGFIAMVDSPVTDVIWRSYVGGAATNEEFVQGIAPGLNGQVSFGGYSNAQNWLIGDAGVDRTSNGGTDGFLFQVVVDSTAPERGNVAVEQQGRGLSMSWGGFSDAELPIAYYEYAIGKSPGSEDTVPYQFVGTAQNATLPIFQPADTEIGYFVTVRATNAVGLSTTAWSPPFTLDPVPDPVDAGSEDAGSGDAGSGDAGTSDGGRPDGGGTPDAGVDAGTQDGGSDDGDGDNRPPLGWSCASSGGPGSLALAGLAVLALLTARRERRGH